MNYHISDVDKDSLSLDEVNSQLAVETRLFTLTRIWRKSPYHFLIVCLFGAFFSHNFMSYTFPATYHYSTQSFSLGKS